MMKRSPIQQETGFIQHVMSSRSGSCGSDAAADTRSVQCENNKHLNEHVSVCGRGIEPAIGQSRTTRAEEQTEK